jgi:hypothetical protein
MMCGCKQWHGGGRFDSCLLDALYLGPVFLSYLTELPLLSFVRRAELG